MADGPDRGGAIPGIRVTTDGNGAFLPVNRKTTQTDRDSAGTTPTRTEIPRGATEVMIFATAEDAATAADWEFGGVTPSTGAGTVVPIPAAFGPMVFGCAGADSVYTASITGAVDIYLIFSYSPDDDWEA